MNKLQFDPIDHRYTLNGVHIPNVTSVLEDVGIVDFSMVPREIIEAAQARGTAVHHATHLYDLGTLNEDTLGEVVRPYLEGWKKFRAETGVMLLSREQMVFSQMYRFAGTLDAVAILFGKPGILDIKTGANCGAAVQTAAYELAYNEPLKAKDRTRARWTLQLKDTGEYSVIEHTSKLDKSIFLSALSVYNYKRRKK